MQPLALTRLFYHPAILLAPALVLNAIVWLMAVKLFPQDDPTAILHYSVGVGIDFIGQGRHITTLPLVGLLVLIMNSLIAALLRRTETSTAWVLSSTALLIQIIMLGAFLLIWRINL